MPSSSSTRSSGSGIASVSSKMRIVVGKDPFARHPEAALGLVTVAAVQGDVNEIVVFTGDIRVVAEALIQFPALEVERARLVELTLHPRRCGAHVKRHSDRLPVEPFGGGVAALGVPANLREVASAQSYA